MKLAGLDFETANGCCGSICSAGCAIVENGRIIRRKEWLVRPHESMDYIAPMCYQVHGIGYRDLRNADEFPVIWPELREMLTSADCAVMHNAPFDLRHLRTVLSLYELGPVRFPYVCSLSESKRMFPQMRHHTLDAMADFYGIVFRHHDALEDAAACALILHKMNPPELKFREFNAE